MNAYILIDFLKQLIMNNNREWFHAHKAMYEQCANYYAELVEHLLIEIAKIDNTLTTVQAKECIFRIYRDVRFSLDKSPYKDHFGAFMAAAGGRKSCRGGYYLHIQPGQSAIVGGIWMPDANELKVLRQSIYENTDEFLEIIHEPSFLKYYKRLDGRPLKLSPKGFPKDYPQMDLLKFKDYIVSCPFDDDCLKSPDFVAYAVERFKAVYPLNRFLNYALDEAEELTHQHFIRP